jgi:TolB-like protein/Flp pilus assembly protein TadD
MADRAEPETTQGPATKETAEVARVFISYASADKPAADSICSGLERGGITCWIAPRDVTPGVFYADAIVEAINSARILIVVLSVNSVGSQHVLREVERASAKRRPLVAIRVDTTPLPTGLEYFLSASHWLDASGGKIERVLPELVTAVHRLLVSPATPGEGVIPPGGGVGGATAIRESTPNPSRKRLWVATVAAVLLLALLVGKLWLSNRSALQNATAPVATLATVPAAPKILEKSIAVLPFTDMSEKHDQEYFGDGMAEEILDLLTKIPGLTVIGRTSSFAFKGKSEDLRTIGAKLNAAYVLEGSVRKAGDQVRITAQLINTRTGAHEWSETYDRQFGDVLKLQDAIAAAVARELQLTLASRYINPRATLEDAEAYDLMLRGRHVADHWDEQGLDDAVTLLKEAIDHDPTSADAAAELAFTYYKQGVGVFRAPTVAFEQARSAAATALKLDPKNLRAHYVLGKISIVYDWDWATAEREFTQVSTLAPGSAYAPSGEARLSLSLGRWDDALRQINAAIAVDPLDPNSFEALSIIQASRGHLPEAQAAVRRALDIRPSYPWVHYYYGLALLSNGESAAALAEIQQEPVEEGKQAGLAMAYHALGRKADSDAMLARMLKEHADPYAAGIASVYAFRGQFDEAMRWLDRAYTQKDSGLVYVKVDAPFKKMGADPRYKAFLRKMNLPE